MSQSVSLPSQIGGHNKLQQSTDLGYDQEQAGTDPRLTQSIALSTTVDETTRRREKVMESPRTREEILAELMESPSDQRRLLYQSTKDQETADGYSIVTEYYEGKERGCEERPSTPFMPQVMELSVISEKRSPSLSMQSGGKDDSMTPIPVTVTHPNSPVLPEKAPRPHTEPGLIVTSSPDSDCLESDERLLSSPANPTSVLNSISTVRFDDIKLQPEADKSIGGFSSQPLTRQRSFDDPVPLSHLFPIEPQSSTDPKPVYLSYNECLLALHSSDCHNFISAGRIQRNTNWWKSMFCCVARTELSEKSSEDLDLLLALDRRPVGIQGVDNAMMRSLWNCHFPEEDFSLESCIWQSIGFRTPNPRAEASTLCILQLLYLSHNQPDLSSQLLLRSLLRGLSFNFALEICGITHLTVKLARAGKMNARIMRSDDVFDTFNDYFVRLVRLWLSEHVKTAGEVDWKGLEGRVIRSPKMVFSV